MLTYFDLLARILHENANPADAIFMKKYMLNQFEYFGIRSPKLKELRRKFFKQHGLPEFSALQNFITLLWQQPQREFQYTGIDITEKLLQKSGEMAITTIEFMITQKSWWDTVDWIASHHAGTYFRLFPQHLATRTGNWMDSDNMWLQRAALLFQLKYKAKTDESLLFEYISRLKTSKEFFIRKAIGWSLREYSKTAPENVLLFLGKNSDLAGLSRREALKWIERKNNKALHG